MNIDDFFKHDLNNKKYIASTNVIEEFIKLLENTLNDMNKTGNRINITSREYNVFSRVEERDYTILSYEDNGKKLLKVSNEILPEDINSRTVLNQKNGVFIINDIRTNMNEKLWQKKQINEIEGKEGKVYMLKGIYNDFVTGIDIKTGKELKIQERLGNNVLSKINLGDFLIMKDGKFIKYNGELNYGSKMVRDEIEANKKELEESRVIEINENKQENKADSEVKKVVESPKEILYLRNNTKEQKPEIGSVCVVTNVLEKKIELENVQNGNIFWLKKDEKQDIIPGDFIEVTKEYSYSKYNGEISVGNEQIEKDLKHLYEWIV